MNIRKVMVGWLAIGALASVLSLANEAVGVLGATYAQDLPSHMSGKSLGGTASQRGTQGSAACFYPVTHLEVQRDEVTQVLTAWYADGRIISYDPAARTLTTWPDACSDAAVVQTGINAFGEDDLP